MVLPASLVHKGWGESIVIGVAAAGQEIATRRKLIPLFFTSQCIESVITATISHLNQVLLDGLAGELGGVNEVGSTELAVLLS
jgi:hypothetical protein